MTYKGDPIAEKLDKLAEATGMPGSQRKLQARDPMRFRVLPSILLALAVAGMARADRSGRPCGLLDRLGGSGWARSCASRSARWGGPAAASSTSARRRCPPGPFHRHDVGARRGHARLDDDRLRHRGRRASHVALVGAADADGLDDDHACSCSRSKPTSPCWRRARRRPSRWRTRRKNDLAGPFGAFASIARSVRSLAWLPDLSYNFPGTGSRPLQLPPPALSLPHGRRR